MGSATPPKKNRKVKSHWKLHELLVGIFLVVIVINCILYAYVYIYIHIVFVFCGITNNVIAYELRGYYPIIWHTYGTVPSIIELNGSCHCRNRPDHAATAPQKPTLWPVSMALGPNFHRHEFKTHELWVLCFHYQAYRR